MSKANRLGCLTLPAIVATIFTFFLITGTVLANGNSFFSPGDLSARSGPLLGNITSHAQISRDCEQCHTAPWDIDSMADRCMRCHTKIKAELADPHKLHGILKGANSVLECRKCHPEHRGAGETLTDVTLNNFPHELLGFSTVSHKQLPDGTQFICQTCHVKDYKSFKNSDCADCHSKINATFMTTHTKQYGADCLSCHDGKETINKKFDHSQTAFPLVDSHTTLACASCHNNSRTIADFKKAPVKCVGCHLKDEPHKGKFGTTCDACHTQKSWKDAHFDHAVTGFKLVGKHEKVECAKCHTTPDQFNNTPATCAGCHLKDDKHAGTEGTACENCHTSDGWKPSTFNHFNVFKLEGKHAALLCQNCHTTPFQFKNLPSDCVGCHQKDDAHKGDLGTACGTCHNTTAWHPASFDHNLAAFKLNGAHVNVQCAQCHINGKFKGTPMTCIGCHQKDDKHAGAEGTACETCHTTTAWKPSTFNHFNVFVLNGKHATLLCANCHTTPFQFKNAPMSCFGCHQKDDAHKGALGTTCSTCHNTTAWKPASFDHNLSAFKLTGSHVSVQCGQCHINGKYKGTPMTCVGCHQKDDKHAGTEGTACESCHNTTAWKPSTFNHFNVFKLEGKHAALLCASCHTTPFQFKNAPMTCFGCHQKNDTHKGAFGTDCSTCHNTTAWKIANFDHNQFPFKLTGAHVSVQCTQCHTNSNFKSTPTACVACHAARDVHAGGEGTACEKCHTTTAWKPTTFNHSSVFTLVGAHTSVVCAKCHLTAPKFNNTPTTCFGCHKATDVHGGTEGTACESCHTPTAWKPSTFNHNNAAFKLTGAHVSTLCAKCHTIPGRFKPLASDCASCHTKNDVHKGAFGTACNTCHNTTAWKIANFDHNQFPFKLTGAHVSVACTLCHTTSNFKSTPTACVACHAARDVHAGGEGTVCEKCHTTTAWKPTTFNHSSVFALVGAHTSVVCAKCHLTAPKFNNTPTTCFGCHKATDAHGGTEGTACESCHTPTAWKPSTFNHNNAAFKLTGAHVSTICAKCHTTPDIFKPTASDCYSCHKKDDHHAGAFGTACGACHSTTAWLPASFDHNLSAFKLTGSHVGVACTSCHINNVFKGTPTTCFACHKAKDVHKGTEGTACEGCHTPAAWKPSTFNHNNAAFKLTGAHTGVACAKCHTISGQFKGTPATCVSCHAEPAFHAGSFGTNCAQCHTTTNWNATYTGSHPKVSGGDGGTGVNHGHTTCKTCHTVNLKTAICTACHDSNNPGN